MVDAVGDGVTGLASGHRVWVWDAGALAPREEDDGVEAGPAAGPSRLSAGRWVRRRSPAG
ncbi:hypothetical protein ACQP2Y_15835 [Actinoplanes sp. CA-051413]|uniref:hypothetical protein n=1 Tax=Actinoplanes sp. CA-051413 TaxID=3239899 RepID=UPI003D97CCFE